MTPSGPCPSGVLPRPGRASQIGRGGRTAASPWGFALAGVALVACSVIGFAARATAAEPGPTPVAGAATPPPDAWPPVKPVHATNDPRLDDEVRRKYAKLINFKFENANLDAIRLFISKMSGLVIIDTARKQGTVSVNVEDLITVEQALAIYDSMLLAYGAVTERVGDQITIVPVERARSIATPVFRGSDPQTPPPTHQVVTQLVPLRYLTVRATVEQLRPLIASFGNIAVDDRTNALIITDTGANLRRILSIISELDKEIEESRAVGAGVQIYKLQHASVEDVSPVITTVLKSVVPGADPPRPGQRPDEATKETVLVSADRRTNSLIVVGTPASQKLAAELIKTLDVSLDAQQVAREIRVFALKNAKADEVADTLNLLFGPGPEKTDPRLRGLYDYYQRVLIQRGAEIRLAEGEDIRITSDSSTNSVIVSASRTTLAVIEDLIKELDQAPPVPTAEVRMFALKHARAETLVQVLTTVYQARLRSPQPGRGGGPPTQPIPFSAAADPRANALVVSASRQDFPAIEELIKSLDIPADEGVRPVEIRVIHLKNAEAVKLLPTLQSLFTQQQQQQRSPRGGPPIPTPEDIPTRIEASELANAIIVSGSREAIAQVEEILTKLDVGEDLARRQPQLKVIPLKSAKAEELAPALLQMFAQGPPQAPGRRQGLSPQAADVRIAVDRTGNALIVSAPPTELAAIEAVVQSLDQDQPGIAGIQVRVIQLTKARAVKVAPALMRLFQQQAQERRGPQRGQPQSADAERVAIEADDDSNCLIIAASPANFTVLEGLVKELDEKVVDVSTTEVRVVPLKHGQAKTVAAVLTQVLGGVAAAPARGGRQPAPGAPQPAVIIAADERANALLVSAPSKDLKMIEELVAQLDVADAPAGEVQVTVVPIENAVAADLAQTLNAVFGEAAPSPQAAQLRQRAQQVREALGGPAVTTSPVRVFADAATNALVVVAAKVDLVVVQALIRDLDKPGAAVSTVEVRVIPLKNADAVQLAATLQTTLSLPAPTATPARGQRPPRPAAAAPGEESLTVTADPRTNALIISAVKERMAVLERLIAELDVPMDTATAQGGKEFRIIHLQSANPVSLADVVRRMFQTEVQRQGGPRAPAAALDKRVTIEPDLASQALLVMASREDFAIIERIVSELDPQEAQIGPVTAVQIFPLKYARAQDLVPTLTLLYNQVVEQREKEASAAGSSTTRPASPAPAAPKATVSVDAPSNALIISATQADLQLFADWLDKLDREGARGGVELRVYPVRYGNAAEIVGTLEKLFPKTPAARPAQQQQGRREEQPPTPSAAKVDARFAADERTNSVLVWASRADLDLLDGLFAVIDVELAGGETEIRIFTLKNISAAEVIRNLSDIFATESPGASPGGRGRPAGLQAQYLQHQAVRLAADAGMDPERVLSAQVSGRLRVSAGTDSNAVIVAGPPEVLAIVGEIIRRLDQSAPDGEMNVRLVPLAHADANEVAATLGRMFGPVRSARTRRGGTPSEQATFAADARTGALLVRASDADFKLIEALVRQLDAEGESRDAELKLYELKHAAAADAARTVQMLLAGGQRAGGRRPGAVPDQPVVTADPRTNTLIVQARSADLARIELLIQTIDREDAADVAELRSFRLENATPAEAASVIQQVIAGGRVVGRRMQQIQEQVRALRLPGRPDTFRLSDAITVVPSTRGNVLLVTAPAEVFPLIEEMVKAVDEAPVDVVARVKVFPLKNARAVEAAPTVQSMFQAQRGRAVRQGPQPGDVPVVITADDRTNALVVSATEKQMEDIEALVQLLDQPVSEEQAGRLVRVIPLAGAQAGDLVRILQQHFADAAGSRRGPRGQAPSPAQEVTLSADERTNSIVVQAPAERIAAITDLVKQLDGIEDEGMGVTVRVFELANADAVEVSRIIGAFFTGPRWQPGRRPAAQADEVRLSADPRTNTLLVQGTAKHFTVIEGLLAKLDAVAADTAAKLAVHVIPLKSADAGQLSRILAQMYGPTRTRGRPDESLKEVRVGAEPATNSLVVAADAETFAAIEKLVADLDTQHEQAEEVETRVVAVANARASDVARALAQLYVGQGGRMPYRRGAEPEAAPAFVPDDRSGALIVKAPKKHLAEIEALVARLDAGTQPVIVELRVFALADAQAPAVANVLTQVLSGRAAPQMRGRFQQQVEQAQQLIIRLKKDAEDAGREFRISDAVNIIPDQTGNTVTVTAPSEMLELVEAVVKDLDRAPEQLATEVRLVPLQSAQASQVRETLTQLFGQQRAGGRMGGWGRGGQPQEVPPTITADDRINALLIRATKDDFTVILDLVQKMDESTGIEGAEIRVVVLANAQAADVAAVLQQFFRAAPASQGGRPRALPAALGTEVIISADARTNAVVFTAPREQAAAIQQLITELDKADPERKVALKTFQLKHADADQVANAVRSFLMGAAAPGGRVPPWMRRLRPTAGAPTDQPTVVVADARTRSVLVQGPETDLALVETLVASLDQPDDGDATVHLVKLLHADAADLAATLQSILNVQPVRGPSRGGPQAAQRTLTITSDPKTNSLLIFATEEEFTEVNSLVQKLDVPESARGGEPKVFRLEYARAAEAARTIQSLFSGGWQRGRGAAQAPSDSLTITADDRSNTLIVMAAPKALLLIEHVLQVLDAEPTTSLTELRLFELKSASPSEVGRVLGSLFGGQGAGQPYGRRFQNIQERVRTLQYQFREAQADRGVKPEAIKLTLAEAVSVTPDDRTRTLMVTAPSEAFPIIEDLIKALDRETIAWSTEVRVFPMQNAQASQVVRTLDQMFRQQQRSQRTGNWGGQGTPAPTIAADDRTNALVIAAAQEDFEAIQTLIDKLDTPTSQTAFQPRLIPLANATAADVAKSLERFFRAAPGAPRDGQQTLIGADERTNVLIVAAGPDQYATIERLVKELDKGYETERPKLKVVALQNGDATEIARTVEDVFRPGGVADVDVPPWLQRFGLQQGDMRGRKASLVQVVADRRTNTLLIMAPERHFAAIETLVAQLDSPDDATAQVRLITLQHADAVSLAATLQNALRQGQRGQQRPGGRQDVLSISADGATNTLLVFANERDFTTVEDLVKSLDVEGTGAGDVRIIRFENADAAKMQVLVERMYAEQRRPGQGASLVTAVEPTLNALVVRGEKRSLELVEKLARQLDDDTKASGREVKVIPLTAAVASTTAKILQRVLIDAAGPGRPGAGQAAPTVIEADDYSNTLIISATQRAHEQIAELLAKLDAGEPTTRFEWKTFTLERARASDVSYNLELMLGLQAPAAGGRSGSSYTVIPDDRTNTIIVMGSKDVLALAEDLLKDLDVGPAGTTRPAASGYEWRLVSLENADPATVVATIRALMDPDTGLDGWTLLTEEVTRLKVRSPEGRQLELNLEETIRLYPDAGTGSILLSASDDNLRVLEELIKVFDKVPSGRAVTVRLFPLKKADATEVAKVLQQLFRQERQQPPPQPGQQPQQGQQRGQQAEGQPQRGRGRSTAVNRSAPGGPVGEALTGQLRISVDPRTNTIVASGTKEALDLLDTLLKELDQTRSVQTVIQVFPLEHADAAEMVQTLRATFLESPSRQQGQQMQALREQVMRLVQQRGGAPAVQESGDEPVFSRVEVKINAHVGTNSVVVSGTEDSIQIIADLIKTLDQGSVGMTAKIHLIPLQHAEADAVAALLSRMFTGAAVRSTGGRPGGRPGQAQTAGGAQVPVLINADPRTNTLVVSATDEVFKDILDLAQKLDVEEARFQLDIRLIALENADAGQVAQALTQLFRDRVAAPRTRGQQAGARPEDRITIIGDPRTNSLLVNAAKATFDEIAALAKQLDQPAVDAQVVLVRLQFADASDLAAVIRQTFADARAAAGRRGTQPQAGQIVISADIRTNQLLIKAGREDLASIQDLVKQLDVEEDVETTVRVYSLKYAEAQSLAGTITQLVRGGAARGRPGAQAAADRQLTVTADGRTNALVVTGSKSAFALVESLIKTLDAEPAEELVEIRILPLKNTDAATVAALVQQVLAAGAQPQPRGQAARGRTSAAALARMEETVRAVLLKERDAQGQPLKVRLEDAITIVADTRGNALVVTGPSRFFPLVDQLVGELEQAALVQFSEIQVVTLKNADAAQVTPILQQMFRASTRGQRGAAGAQTEPIIAPDARTNALVISAGPEAFAILKDLITRLDAEAPDAESRIRVVVLKNADATDVSRTLTQLYAQQARGGTRARQPVSDKDVVLITADSRSNALLIMASDQNFKEIETLAKQLDEAESVAALDMHIITLENSDASRLAPMLNQMWQVRLRAQSRQGRPAPEQQVSVLADPRTNSLVVAANADNIKAIRALVEQMEAVPESEIGKVVIIPVENGDADEMARTLTAVFRQRRSPGQGAPITPTTIAADTRTNSLLVTADKEDLEAVRDLVRQLDAADKERVVEVIVLQHADAADLVPILQSALSGLKAAARGARGGTAAGDVTLVADARTNSLVLTGRPKEIDDAKALIAKFDVEGLASQFEVRVVSLKNADATTLSRTLTQLYAQQIQGQRGRQPVSEKDRIFVSADARSNTLLIVASDENFKLVEALARQLDEAEAVAALDIHIVTLEKADASQMAPSLQRMFQERARARTARGGQAGPEDQVNIIADLRTNSLLVTASKDNLAVVQELVKSLEAMPESDLGKVVIIPLQYADAAELAGTLQNLFRQRTRTGAGAPAIPTTILADSRANALLVTAGKEDLDALRDLVRQVDIEQTEAVVRVFPLVNAKAAELGQVLTQTLRTAVQGRPRGAVQLSVSSDARTNALIVTGSKSDFAMVEALIKTLDARAPEQVVEMRVFALTNALSADLVRTLQDVLAVTAQGPQAGRQPASAAGKALQEKAIAFLLQQKGPDGQPLKIVLEDQIKLTPDAAGNSVVVTAPQMYFALVQELIEALDRAPALVRGEVRVVALEFADAAKLAPMLQRLLQAQQPKGVPAGAAPPLSLSADERTNTLVIGASTEDFGVLERLIKDLDKPSAALLPVNIITLKNADATKVAAMLTQFFGQQAGSRAVATDRDRIIVAADQRSNMLLVYATEENFKKAEELATTLDTAPLAPTAEIHIVALDDATLARTLAPKLQTLFQQRIQAVRRGAAMTPDDFVSITAEESRNALLIAASAENYQIITKLLEDLKQAPAYVPEVKVVALRYTTATRVAATLTDLFNKRQSQAGAQRRPEDNVTITPDERTNSLLVQASQDNLRIVETLVATLDQKDAVETEIRLFTLKNSDAAKLAVTLDQVFKEQQRRGPGAAAEGAITVKPDERTNILIVSAAPTQFPNIERVITDLDSAPRSEDAEVQVYEMQYADAVVLGPVLKSLFDARQQRLGAGAGARNKVVVITPDERTNSLVVSAEREDQPLIKGIVDMLDKKDRVLIGEMKVIPLEKAEASRLVTTLTQLYTTARPGKPPLSRTFNIAVDQRTNALIVWAEKEELPNIEKLVKELDTAQPKLTDEIRIVPLVNAEADVVTNLLKQALGSGTTGGAATAGARMIQFRGLAADGIRDIKALNDAVSVTADLRTNSLICIGSPEVMGILDLVIRELDREPPIVPVEVRVFALENADCTDMARLLTDLFRLQGATAAAPGRTPEQRRQELDRIRLVAGFDPMSGMGGLGAALDEQFSITADVRTNSLVVAGSKEYIGVVASIIDRLDREEEDRRQFLVYNVRNTIAKNVADSLNKFYEQKRQRESATAAGARPVDVRKAIEEEIFVVAEEKSNTLMVYADVRDIDKVEQLIAELDRQPRQVIIKALIAEVTLDSNLEFGLEFSVLGIQVPNRRPDQLLDVATDFGVEGMLSGGASIKFSTPDLNMILRALKTDGRLEVLSSPHITVTDNQSATINVGQRVPVVNTVRVTEAGTQTSAITYEDVGIILHVTPHITPDGYVNLDINPVISGIGTSTVKVSETFSAATYFNRSVETQVSIRDGETIVIGGLITDDRTTTSDSVPILGQIPLLKYLFSRTKQTRQKAELLIVITPTIVPSPDDLAEAGQRALMRESGMPQRYDRYGVPKFSRYDLYKMRQQRLQRQQEGGGEPADVFQRIAPRRQPVTKPKADDTEPPPANGKELTPDSPTPLIKETKIDKPNGVIINGKG